VAVSRNLPKREHCRELPGNPGCCPLPVNRSGELLPGQRLRHHAVTIAGCRSNLRAPVPGRSSRTPYMNSCMPYQEMMTSITIMNSQMINPCRRCFPYSQAYIVSSSSLYQCVAVNSPGWPLCPSGTLGSDPDRRPRRRRTWRKGPGEGVRAPSSGPVAV